MRIYVAIATVGRSETSAEIVRQIGRQTRLPDGILVVGASEEDYPSDRRSDDGVQFVVASRGLCCQRNEALRRLGGLADLVVFLDDDFVMNDAYLENVESLFASRPNVAGATGWLMADGAKTGSISFDEAVRLVATTNSETLPDEKPADALYGCNMVVRMSEVADMRFDENLPLYGWLEDIDFTFRLRQRGALVRTRKLSGVHMGVRGGRTSGVRLGYSQVMNPIYLLRKMTVPKKLALRLITSNVTSNLVKSIRPEAHVDRRGRLVGNLRAFADLLRMRIDPKRVLKL